MVGVPMRSIKSLRVCPERTQAGIGAKIDGSPAIFGTREVLRISIDKDSSAERDKMQLPHREPFRACWHPPIVLR